MEARRGMWRLVGAAGVLVALVISACGQPTTTGPTAAPTAVAAKRGDGGTLRILYWQAATILNPHLAQGTKDFDALRLVLEPLAHIGPDGKPIAALAAEVPTRENGGISADYKTITWKLKQGVKWSDGSEFTADDVVFTYQYMSDKATAATTAFLTEGVKSVTAKDKSTVVVEYTEPNPTPYQIFVAGYGNILQKKQFADFLGAKAKDAPGNSKPIGTGPYKVREFKPDDVVIYDINENYREASKPFFKEVQFKGGGDANSAARAVFSTGDADYAWNLQVPGAVLKQYSDTSQYGKLVTAISSNVERIELNRTDSRPSAGENRGEPTTQHPFLSDKRVRTALAMAVDRKALEELYGSGLAGSATCNIISGQPEYNSPNTAKLDVCKYDLAAANKLLDEAGWAKGSDGIRAKGGVRMEITYQTSVNALRQSEQDVVKKGWDQLGIKVTLKAVPSGTFFSSDVANPDTAAKFWADVQMYTNGQEQPDPTTYLALWTTAEIKTKAQQWRGQNYARWSSKDFDALYAQLTKELDPKKRTELIIKMNDLIVEDVALIPLIARTSPTSAISKKLQGVKPNPWDSEMWNVADWTKSP